MTKRSHVIKEAVIRERFDRYRDLPAMRVETMRPAHEVAAAIHARLAADAPEAFPAALRTPAADHAPSNVACS